MSQEIYKLLPFLKPISGSAKTTPEQKTQALQRQSAEQIRQGGGLTGQTKTKELYKLFPFLQPAAGNSQPKASGTKIKIGDKYYDTGFHSKEIAELRKQNPGGGNAAQSVRTGLSTSTGNRDARLDPNATEQYASNFKAGQANMSDIQEMYADRKDLQEWAKANPALAQKEFAKSGFQSTRMKNADIQDQMDDTGRSRDDIIAINNGGLETVIDGSSIGNSTPQDAQAFKNAAAQLVAKGQLPSSMNAGSTPIISGVTPMIEGIELSTAVKPDYKAEMEDGVMNQLAKGLDIPTKRFASQNLKDLFMNNMLGK